MMNRKILKYTFSLILLLMATQLNAQFLKQLNWQGVMVGVDAHRFADYVLKPERTAYSGALLFNLGEDYFVVLEPGYSSIDLKQESYTYKSKGEYLELGFDKNMLNQNKRDFFGIGLRLGYSNYRHHAENISFSDPYWGEYTTSIEAIRENALWVDVVLGIRSEIVDNLYFGWSARLKIFATGERGNNLIPYDIPGFGKGAENINMAATYTIYYRFDWGKSKL